MRILVTGAEGFVGQHLCAELHQAGHTVLPSDIEDHDLAKPNQANRLIMVTRPDYVVHLAARYGRLLCRDEPHRAVADNTASTTELAAVCAKHGLPVLYASSSEVYGDHGTETIYEDSALKMPTTIYGLSKRWGEEVLRLYLPPDDLTVVRMNMLYGPGQLGGYGRCSLATFIDSAVRGETFTVHRHTSRSWLYIADAVRALRLLIDGQHTGTFNLGNPTPPQTMTSVALEVTKLTGVEATIEDAPAGQIRHKMYDSTKLLDAILWEPRIGIEAGVAHDGRVGAGAQPGGGMSVANLAYNVRKRSTGRWRATRP